MNKKTASLLIIVAVLLVIAVALAYFAPKNKEMQNGVPSGTATPTSGTTAASAEAKEVTAVVTAFGANMQKVPLSGTHSTLVAALESAYGPYVSADLMIEWERGTLQAPGRKTSSPWPDHIVINSVKAQADGTYEVAGKVVEFTSATTSEGSAVGAYPVTITLAKEGGQWYITKYGEGARVPINAEMTIRGDYSCLPKKDTSGPVTLECALGVKTDDGLYYAIDMSQLDPGTTASGVQTGDRVEVSGLFVPIDLVTGMKWDTYKVTGVITAKAFAKI
jgi:hypothetical protein